MDYNPSSSLVYITIEECRTLVVWLSRTEKQMGITQVAITYDGLLDPTGKKWQIGGVETYLWHLSRVCLELGWNVTAYQTAAIPFTTHLDQVNCRGCASSKPPSANSRETTL